MKKLLSTLALFLAITSSASATKYSLSNGSFSLSGISLLDGDTLEIPAGRNVTLSSSQTISARIVFNIYGNLNITGSNKTLTLSANASIINLYPQGSISGTNNSIFIGTNQVFNGTALTNNTATVMTATGITNGFGGGGATPLPLQFISFEARLSASATVVLSWSAVNDGANGVFTIQQSTDGKTWSDRATVAAEGADHQMVSYSRELSLPTGAKTLLYRMAYTTTTGERIYTQSRSLSLNQGATAAPVVAVVAASSTIEVRISGVGTDGQSRLLVTSLDGRILANQTIGSDGLISIPASQSGMYVVTVTDNKSFKNSQKVVLN